MKRNKASILIRSVIILATIVPCATLLLLEGWCRFSTFHNLSFPPHQIKYDNKLGYRYNPEHPFYKDRFRGIAEAQPKNKGVTRIVCLGESSTSCDMLVDGSKTWPYRLEQYLNDCYVFSPVRHPKIVSFGLTTSDKATVDENS
jgi:hypothetical protein